MLPLLFHVVAAAVPITPPFIFVLVTGIIAVSIMRKNPNELPDVIYSR